MDLDLHLLENIENTTIGIEHPEDISGIYLYKFRDPWGNSITPELIRYRILRETPKGYWVYNHDTFKEKWISKNGFKRYAHFNKKDALYAYYRKKLVHIKYINQKFDQLKGIIELIEKKGNIKTFPHLKYLSLDLDHIIPYINKHNDEISWWKALRIKKDEFIEEGEMIV